MAASFAEFLDALGVDWRWWDPVGVSPVDYMDALQVLGPRSLLVHGVVLDEADFKASGESRCESLSVPTLQSVD